MLYLLNAITYSTSTVTVTTTTTTIANAYFYKCVMHALL